MSTIDLVAGTSFAFDRERWERVHQYRIDVLLIGEDDGTVSAIALNLPGVGSCGDTEENAIANVSEAATLAIESYTDSHAAIPWKEIDGNDIPPDTKHKRIIVNV